MRKKIVLAIGFLILIVFQDVFATQNKNIASGLLFKSKTESIDERTTLDLFNGRYQKFKNKFTISFDISIWDTKRFGYILRLIKKDGNELSLVFVNFRDENNFFFDFNSSISNRSVQIAVEKHLFSERKWMPVTLDFDLTNDKAIISLFDKEVTCENLGLDNRVELKCIFGLYGINLDVPSMAIKNIKITENNITKYIFPLNESTGNDIHNIKGKNIGMVKNPIWLINEHFNWKEIIKFKADCTAGIAYNNEKQQVFIVDKDSINIFEAGTYRLTRKSISPIPFDIISGEAIYNSIDNKTYIYNLDTKISDTPSFIVLDMETLEWTHSGSPNLMNRLHHHNVFFSAHKDSLFIFGGYGNFTYSNKIYYYGREENKWINIPLSGDTLYPRFFSASGKGTRPSEILIFGGFGNKSGKQELGGRNLYDLISIDIEQKKVRKLWELSNTTEDLFVPCNNLIVNDDGTSFYTLCYPHHIPKTELSLLKFDMLNGSYQIVSNSIPILSEEIATGVYLFYNDLHQEFIAVVREYVDESSSEIRIYTLSAPPVSSEELIAYQQQPTYWLPLTILIIIMLLTGYIIYRIRRKVHHADDMKPINEKPTLNEIKIKRNAVYTIGDFLVFDKEGKDITYRFSPKIKLLFAVLLLNNKNDNEGISTVRMSSEVWPDREFNESKNIRGVTINHLRSVLADLEGIELIHNNQKWYLSIHEGFYCDYIQSMQITENIFSSRQNPVKYINTLIDINKRGVLFENLASLHIDNYRVNYEVYMTNALQTLMDNNFKNGMDEITLKLVEALLVIDPLNEDALIIGIQTLKKANKNRDAKKIYDAFTQHYKISLGENYKKSWESL